MLIDTLIGAGQRTASAEASRRTHSLSAAMLPVRSASGMNWRAAISPRSKQNGGFRRPGRPLQNGELVTAEAGDAVVGSKQPCQKTRGLHQELVADRVAEEGVGVLEAVEIDEQERRRGIGAARSSDGL